MPHPGSSWQPHGRPATQPHEYVRGGTCKLLTLFQPASGRVHVQPDSRCTNPILHGWLKQTLAAVIAALPAPTQAIEAAACRAAWQKWQDGLAERFTLPEHLPPLRLLLVWDNLTGHKSAEMVVWLCQHGVMPLYTPLGGSWLNMAESIQRILKRRALAGQHPHSPAEIGTWLAQTARAWNQQPTPFTWHGRRWRRRRHHSSDGHPIGSSAAQCQHPHPTLKARRQEWQVSRQLTH